MCQSVSLSIHNSVQINEAYKVKEAKGPKKVKGTQELKEAKREMRHTGQRRQMVQRRHMRNMIQKLAKKANEARGKKVAIEDKGGTRHEGCIWGKGGKWAKATKVA